MCVFERRVWCFSSSVTELHHTHAADSNVEALVPGLPCPPLSEVQVDVGGYEIIHLVTLWKQDKDVINST